jgi:predicted DNA-binding transcriptional regulator AlpA
MSPKPKRFLRLPQVTEKTGLPQSSIYEKKAKGEFPKPIKLGPQTVALGRGRGRDLDGRTPRRA